MEQYLREYGLAALTSILATFGGCLAGGCTIALADKGEFGFAQSTRWGFYHEATKTEATATSNVDAPALMDWVTGKDEPVDDEQ